VGADQTLAEVAETLNRYSINGLPVMDGDMLVGIIGRQMVDRALHLDLGDQQVGLYMNTRFRSVTPEDDLADIRDHLVRDYQRILPVMSEGRLVGVITRKDILDTFIQEEERLPDDAGDSTVRGRMRKKSVSTIIRELLPKRIVGLLEEMGATAEEMGMHAYAVGGFVRDLILRRPNLDVDVVVEGDGINFAQVLAARTGARVRHHDKFGTAVLIFPDGFKVDVATARLEYYQHPGALPTVESSSLKLDLYRRDFSINTMAIELNPVSFGTLVDHFFGQRDLKDQRIRVLHNLSFVEDPTRALRALRFEARFGFKLGKHTERLLANTVKEGFLDRVAGRRVFTELKHILQEVNPVRIIGRMAEFGLLSAVYPGFVDSKKTMSVLGEIGQVISWYRLSYLKKEVENWRIYLLGLLHEMPDFHLDGFNEKLELGPKLFEWIVTSRKRIKHVRKSLGWARARKPYEIYKALEGMDTEAVLYLMAISPERVRKKVSLYLMVLKDTRIELTGKDLIRMGYEPGPLFKEILESLLKARLNQEVKSLEDEMAYVAANYPVRPAEEGGITS
jgi:tRNA nucleotidyltransferase (CCA-adding enzyme)